VTNSQSTLTIFSASPLGERLPQNEEWVDIAGEWGETIGYYDGEDWLNTDSETSDEVTHWRKRTPGPGGTKPELPTG
jgi:hypothetical protein